MSVERIFISFLEYQKTSDAEYQEQLKALAHCIDGDGDLETDGHATITSISPEGSPDVDEDLLRRIGAQLAQMGDQFEREGMIDPKVIETLINDILNESLTEDRFAAAVQSVLNKLPPGIEQEKACLAVAMNLTSKVGRNIPGLLQNCFSTAVTFIQRNYMSYVQLLTRQR
ncbi:BH3-interacting domain death agonist-like [Pseudophryne corroboree]|uniref:BH3-interacting domain death agonist-like n=1 Tax=Pseudophryne corroboree TaxID=495146 RepID=UPI003081C256